ncbi:MAG: hypothetical protein ACI4U5_04875 [Bacilli bacterium]
MDKKKKLLLLLTTLTITPSMVLLSSCGSKKKDSSSSSNIVSTISTAENTSTEHIHNAKSDWSYTDTHHYHECEGCTEKLDYAAHVFDEGVVTKEATFFKNGSKTFTCECGYQKEEVIVFNQITEVAFQKCTEELKYTEIEITEETKGTYYFQYNVTDCEDITDEYYWININKTSQTKTDVTNCKIYDENKEVIKDEVMIMAAGQFMATREGSGEGYDDHDTILKLKKEGIHYFELTFNAEGTYKINVTHYGTIGNSKKWAIPTTYDPTIQRLTSAKKYLSAASVKYFCIELTQNMINDYHEVNGEKTSTNFQIVLKDSTNTTLSDVSLELYDSNDMEITNVSSLAPHIFYGEQLSIGTYYLKVTMSTSGCTCYVYASCMSE